MLSRRHLRIKVLQAVYAFIQSDNNDLPKGEKLLLQSIDKIRELLIFQMSFLIELRDFGVQLIDKRKEKYFPTDDDLDPNLRFVENRLIKQIENNREYRKTHDRLKINWSDDQPVVRKAYLNMLDRSFFIKYMENPENSYDQDKDMLVRLIKKVMTDLELLEDFYESKSIYWAFDTYYTANLMLMKMLKLMEESDDEYTPIPELLKEDEEEEDIAFMKTLFSKTILNGDEYGALIDEKARNWELERIALMDTILIKMALAELMEFPSIPVKVTLNEYIDISKYYSSEKSKVFINGILDKLIVDLKEKKLIKKTGRGLMEF
jgi:N utilization substance protein B